MSTEGIDLLRDNPRTYGRTASRTPPEPSLFLDFARATALDPRITFSRGSQATLFDSTGTLKYAKSNLLTYSDDFADAAWTKNASSITSDATVSPDGTVTGDKLIEDATTAAHGIQSAAAPTTAVGAVYTVSVYAKKSERDFLQIFFTTGHVTGNPRANYDLSAGILGTVDSGISAQILSVGNGWYRCVATVTVAASGLRPFFNLITSSSASRNASYAGDGTSGIFIWGAQLNLANMEGGVTSSLTTYYPTTTAAYYAPRFDYNPSTLQPLGLLIEEQRTNLLTYSEDFANAAWTKSNASITSNTIVAPDGTLTGEKLINNSGVSGNGTFGSDGIYRNAASMASGSVYTISCYVKAGENDTVGLSIADSNFGTGGVRATADLGALTTSNVSNAISSLRSVGNGWYRFIVTSTTTLSTTGTPRCYIYDPTTGDGTSGVYIWGAQAEAGAFATSYIPTTTTALTRSADAANMTGTNFSSWFNNAEGTVYAEAATNGTASTGGIFRLVNVADTTRRMRLSYASGTALNFAVTDSTTQVSLNLVTGLTVGSFNKGAVAYKINDFAGSANGLTALTDTVGTVPAGIDQFVIGQDGAAASTILNGTIRRIAFYPTRLPDATLQALTA